MKPIIYLDVDGVLNFDHKNAFSFDETVILSEEEFYVLRLDSRHGQWLLDLAEKTGSELIWASTWMNLANIHVGPLIGLPELPYVDFGPQKFSQPSSSWKSTGVIKHHENRPFLWFDDDFMIPRYLEHEIKAKHIVHLIGGDGITEKDIDFAYRWLKDL